MMLFNCAYYSERAKTDSISTNALFNDKCVAVHGLLSSSRPWAVQYNAALAVTGCVRGISREKL